jgi:hypothetical protein
LVTIGVAIVVLFAGVATLSAQDGEFAYVGSKKCKKCHLKQFKSWEATTMATTFDALKPGERAEAKTGAGLDPAADYTTDATCVGCHVTGMGKPGGFVDIETTPDLANVGCETCHGAGGTYIQDGYMTLDNKEYMKADIVAVGLVDVVTEAQCVACHNSESPFVGDDYVFDYEAMTTGDAAAATHEHFPLKYEH